MSKSDGQIIKDELIQGKRVIYMHPQLGTLRVIRVMKYGSDFFIEFRELYPHLLCLLDRDKFHSNGKPLLTTNQQETK